LGTRQQGACRPELADIVRAHGAAFCASQRLRSEQHRALRAIERCRTSALGGELRRCDACGETPTSITPAAIGTALKCEARAKVRWLAARRAELLPVPYFHLVFTVAHQLNVLARQRPRELYGALFAAASETLLVFGRNPRWLGGEIAATLVSHTWGQTLAQHPHLHCLVAAGALDDTGRWVRSRRGFLFPVKAVGALQGQAPRRPAQIAGAARAPRCAARHSLGGYAKRPFGGPEQVLEYLGRYTHRTAISNERLVSVDDQAVRFRYKDYAHGKRRRTMQLAPREFLRRFVLHVLPCGFNRIRHYGLLANRHKRRLLSRARSALAVPPAHQPPAAESVQAFWQRVAGIDIERCPRCRLGTLRTVQLLPARAQPP